ncbi:hypothetical protein GCM10009733_050880 [Nonomuraea maheshkhaliensis]|uniref:Uncharacterized protein n=1 Tax=Nonomuraea maheshkhaliensis TaxID=419590 RepID=A0ABN2FHW4_9ACTN
MRLDDEALAELARRLREARTEGWTEPAMRELVAGMGWEWQDGVEPPHREHLGPVLRAGLPTGDAHLRSVRRHMVETYADGEDGPTRWSCAPASRGPNCCSCRTVR